MKKVDYILVGLGIAGACLALHLTKRNRRVLVYDTPDVNRASAIAAGLFNPVTGKRIVKTWKADVLFPFLQQFYQDAERALELKLFHPAPLYTPFRSIEEQNDWMLKSEDPFIAPYVLAIHTKSTYGNEVRDPLGGILLAQCGHVDVPALLRGVRKKLIANESYREENFRADRLEIVENGVSYEGVGASKIIFCTGIHALENGLFGGLPLKPLKGEVITIKTQNPLARIYNRGIYIIENEELHYRVGATYALQNVNPGVTEEGKNELVAKASDLLSQPFKVNHQDWGIRPSTIDRRPLLGEHPIHKNILIFNGLGTKGVSLAPYFSDQLVKYIERGGNLDKEANISRVKSLYSKF